MPPPHEIPPSFLMFTTPPTKVHISFDTWYQNSTRVLPIFPDIQSGKIEKYSSSQHKQTQNFVTLLAKKSNYQCPLPTAHTKVLLAKWEFIYLLLLQTSNWSFRMMSFLMYDS